jgi:predicted dehydrogenase
MNREQGEDQFPLRGAIIGFGNAAIHAHLPLWQKDDRFRIDAVLEPDRDRANLARDLLPESHIHSEVESLLAEEELDFVDICAPPCFHADLILNACRAGLHVFCEKPLATSFESLHEIWRASTEFGKVIFTVNNWKYAPLWTRVFELVHSDIIGVVRFLSLTVLRPPHSGGGVSNWRKRPEMAGGGILLDHGWHHLYLILSVMRGPPLFISARMDYSEENGPDLEEVVDLAIRFPNAEAKLYLTWRAPCRRNFGTIRGDTGTLLLNDDHLILCPEGAPARRYDFPEALSASSHHPEWMKLVVEDFRREIFDARLRGANLIEGRSCTQLTHLAYQSQREGSRPVKVSHLMV